MARRLAWLCGGLSFLPPATAEDNAAVKPITALAVEENPRLRGGNRIDFKYAAPYWTYDKYPQLDPTDPPMPFVTPGGEIGSLQAKAEAELIAEQVVINFSMFDQVIRPHMTSKCKELGGEAMDCIKDFSSFGELYGSLEPVYQPSLAKFYDSDEAFARQRLTNSPMYIQAVTSMDDLPVEPKEVVGLEDIIANTGKTLDQLVEDKQVFKVDFSVYQKSLIPSEGSIMEAPIGVFFIDGKTAKEGKLMPLAIKFTMTNTNTYSPKDDRLDWFFAKAMLDTLDTNIGAINHFVYNHFTIENVCLAATKNFATDHPVYRLISEGCRNNAGVIASGLKILLAPKTGQFDKYMLISTKSIRQKLVPQIYKSWSWPNTYIEKDLENRGVTDIPNFLYKDDAMAMRDSIGKFVTSYVTPHYEDLKVSDDEDLQGFLKDLSTGKPGESAYLKGFPTADDVTKPQDVIDIVTQMMFLTGVSHHALNTFKAWHYEVAFPLRVGKIWKAPPKEKGQIPDEATLVKDYLYLGKQNTTEAFNRMMGAETIPFGFYPFIEASSLMVNGFFRLAVDEASNKAALQLHDELIQLSDTIRTREKATADSLPEYACLDPRNIPYFVFI